MAAVRPAFWGVKSFVSHEFNSSSPSTRHFATGRISVSMVAEDLAQRLVADTAAGVLADDV